MTKQTKKVALLLCVSLLVNVQVFATNVSGLISTNTNWTVANSPYIVTGNVLVNTGITLTIQPGVFVKFNSGLSLQIDGTLIAQGTSSDSITFTSNTADTAGAWGYIYFSNLSVDAVFQNNIYGNYISGSILEYCKIQYAGGVSVSDNGALRFDDAHPFINYCTIANNSANGIRGYNLTGSLKISNSVIQNNTSSDYGGGICISNTGTTLISGNTITKNTTLSYGGGICNMYWSAIIINNIISDNIAGYNGGAIASGLGGISSSPIINNIIMNNSANDAGGIYIYNGTSAVSHNLILNNKANRVGGIFAYGGDGAAISNNVISDNSATGTHGGIWSPAGSGLGQPIHNNHILRNTATNNAGIISDNIAEIKLNTIAYNKNTDFFNTLNRCVFIAANNPQIDSNNIFSNSAFYELYNGNAQGTPNVSAANNWWGTIVDADIQTKIYDWFDINTLGIVNYSPFLATPDTIAPVSPPANVKKINIGGGQLKITWEHNPETDIAGYHLYYGDFNGYSFSDSVNVGNDTSYTLTGISVFDTIAVTAYDSAYSIANENTSTITNDNMTNGNESWFTYAESECSTINLAMSSVDATCSSCSDGTATATVSLGLAPYSYLWNTTPAQTNLTATGLLPGTYTVTIADNNACVLIDSVVVSFSTNIKEEINSCFINIFPNPATDKLYISSNNKVGAYIIYNSVGELVSAGNAVNNTIIINDLPKGFYYAKFKTGNQINWAKFIKN